MQPSPRATTTCRRLTMQSLTLSSMNSDRHAVVYSSPDEDVDDYGAQIPQKHCILEDPRIVTLSWRAVSAV